MTIAYGAICNRCSGPYLATHWPHNCLCPSCHLGSLSPTDRARLLGHLAKTGRRLP